MDIVEKLDLKANLIMGKDIGFGSEVSLMFEASEEIQSLRAKVASADVLVEALETIATESHPELWQVEVAIKALDTYDKLSEVKHDTK